MCYFSCQAQKLPFLAVSTCFLILGKIQDGGQGCDHYCWCQGLQQGHHPWNIPHLVKKIKGFPPKVNRFEILQHIKNSRGLPQPPPPLPTTAGLVPHHVFFKRSKVARIVGRSQISCVIIDWFTHVLITIIEAISFINDVRFPEAIEFP